MRRPGSLTVCATSAASSATSGRRGSCAGLCVAGGRRLAAKGRIQDPEHFVDADFEEMKALLSGTGGPSAEELAERHGFRTSHTAKDVPATLGPPPPPPPDPSGLPPGVARIMRAMLTGVGEIFGSSQAEHEERLVRGLAASSGVYEGPARLVAGPTEFDRIVQGDVLVTESTSEAFNILLPLLGAIVTDARWAALTCGDRLARVRHPERGRDAGGDWADSRRGARSRRRRGRRGGGALMEGVVPLERAHDESLFGSKAVGLGEAARSGLPLPPGVALSGAVVEAVAGGREAGDRGGRRARSGRSAARSPCARRRSTRTGRRRASPAST